MLIGSAARLHRVFLAMLGQLWVLESEMDLWTGRSLASEIERHMVRFTDDWTVLDLFKKPGALTSSNRRFLLFVEGVLSGAVNPDEHRQRALAEAIALPLARGGLKVIETGSTGGYPEFSIVPTGSRARPPQLILFASTAAKPDLCLREVLGQEVEVVGATSGVLRYDRPVPEYGLTWDDLQAWWAEREQLSPEAAKGSLWQRLRSALPANSPPQQALFEKYHRIYGQRQRGERFPALLPAVWLHWDPVAKSARGDEVMLTQRLDFARLGLTDDPVEIGPGDYVAYPGDLPPHLRSTRTRDLLGDGVRALVRRLTSRARRAGAAPGSRRR
ncbi:hypothetical protein F4561_003636 [Lipingzhangella halophila]|uniref:AbiJ-NTD3 domain-containing protein n=1 Tax=Lipingzhangella halophila TaxID=1783352 RepID=A0A7W7RJU5_9ACTN|nr:hypothetical protein [Lipingzhangella halophila]MBB4932816.1 hypothetical protein [Lipingzhangella halophila]